MGLLEGRIALVTGASRNIGRAIAVRFADEGADLAISSLTGGENLATTESMITERGREVLARTADVGRPNHLENQQRLGLAGQQGCAAYGAYQQQRCPCFRPASPRS